VTVRIDPSLGQTLRINPSLGQTLSLYAGGSAAVLKDWPFGGPTPTSLVDQSGYGNDGTFTDITMTQLDSGLWVYGFNGTSSYIDCGRDTSLNLGTGDFSLAAWIKATSGGGDYYFIIDRYYGINNPSWALVLDDNTGALRFILADGSNSVVFQEGSSLKDDAWHHVGISCDRDGNAQMYLDGNTLGDTNDISAISGAVDAAVKDVCLGINANDESSNVFIGSMGLWRIKKALWTSADFAKMYAMEKSLFK